MIQAAANRAPSIPLTLYQVEPAELMQDVYFRRDFLELHAGGCTIDMIETSGFRLGSAIRPIDGTELEDLETPWGYGGPIAISHEYLREGLWLWRQRQREAGRIAEFVRLHPFANPVALQGYFDDLKFDRVTVSVDLEARRAKPHGEYSAATNNCIRRARNELKAIELGVEHADAFRRCYEAGLDRNNADPSYYFQPPFYEALMSAPWGKSWGASYQGEIVAVACFIFGGPLCHYHLSGADEVGRRKFAQYLLIDHALDHFAHRGFRAAHLGGGRTDRNDDPLLLFKRKFSRWRTAFYTGGIVFDAEAYATLSTGDRRRFLNYRFSLKPRPDVDAVSLRPATADDVARYFRLKCDVANVLWSGFTAPPDWRRLAPWFAKQVNCGSGREILMVEMRGHTIGYVYLDQKSDHLESTVAVAASESGRGVGRRVLKLVAELLDQRQERRPVEAWIFPGNVASVKAHEAAGFVLNPARGERCFSMPFAGDGNVQGCWVWRYAA
jgi:UDP-N-acetylbacillosamine alanyltransferase